MMMLFTGLLFGMAGSLHCMGMCGPLFLNLHARSSLFHQLLYFTGKTLTYVIMGILFYGVGSSIVQWLPQHGFIHPQFLLSLIAGSVLILVTVLPKVKQRISWHPYIQRGYQRLHQLTQKIPSNLWWLLSGMLNGALPCGLVYAALAVSLAQSNTLQSIWFMVGFGYGTLPALMALKVLQKGISSTWRLRLGNTSFYLSIAVGIILILRGMNLGIPYVSPEYQQGEQKMECCSKQ